jgi:hypothetical protein
VFLKVQESFLLRRWVVMRRSLRRLIESLPR